MTPPQAVYVLAKLLAAQLLAQAGLDEGLSSLCLPHSLLYGESL
jgi:hypothetical protein